MHMIQLCIESALTLQSLISTSESWNKSVITSKSKTEELIATLAFDEIRELDKNDDVVKKSRFISSVVVETKSLCQFNAEVENAEVHVKIDVKEADKETSACFFTVFADQHDLSWDLTASLRLLIASSMTESQSWSITYFQDTLTINLNDLSILLCCWRCMSTRHCRNYLNSNKHNCNCTIIRSE